MSAQPDLLTVPVAAPSPLVAARARLLRAEDATIAWEDGEGLDTTARIPQRLLDELTAAERAVELAERDAASAESPQNAVRRAGDPATLQIREVPSETQTHKSTK